MLICETDRVRRAESDAAGSDPNSGGKKEEIDSEENQDGGEKLFTESQVNKIVQLRLEKDRLRVDKEVENRLKELGIESPEDAEASREWRREREELLERTSREQDLIRKEMTESESRLGAQADNAGVFVNIWNDVEGHYFERAIYTQLMDEVDFALFETWVYNTSGVAESETVWLRRVNAAQDMVKNRRAVPVVDGRFGPSLWYGLATLLLLKENGKGMIWFQSDIPDTAMLNKMLTLDCGQPLEDYHLISNSYYRRDWEECIILVNPKTGSTGTISLGVNYTDMETGGSVSSIVLPAKSGAVLIKQ